MGAPSQFVGQTISHYRILRKLGSGGMGVVYEAEDLRLHRHVAVKFLPDAMVRDQKALLRLEREARAASALNHPNICTIYEVEEHDHQPVIVMEMLDGETLKERISRGSVSTHEVLEFGIQASEALDAAHAKGIIHRDIKPGNIFIVGGRRIKILDFGLAKKIASDVLENESDEESLTAEGVIPGTTGYMSPEQARGEEVDTRTDLFSLGVVLYEMATGTRPFLGKNRVILMDAILNARPVVPSHVNHALPSSFDAIIGKLLEKDRTLRYQHADDLGSDLKRLKLETDSGQIAVAAVAPAAHRKNRRSGWKLSVSGVLAILSLVGVFLYVRRPHALTEKDTIVLADFENKTGDDVFDETLKQALAVDLSQSPFLNILSDRKVTETLRLMGREPTQRVTGEVARELCQRVGSKAMLEGSISSLGDEYVLGLNAINCSTGDVLVADQARTSGKSEVLKAIDKSASVLRNKLGESLASVQKFSTPVEEATTSSLEALKAYSIGRRVFFQNGDAPAVPYYERAIELDPNFAMAYTALAVSYDNLGQATRATENASAAFKLRERVSEGERYRISAYYYTDVTGELDKARQTYELWRQSYPRDILPPGNLGDLYMKLGQWEKALRETQEVGRLEPNSAVYNSNLAEIQLALNRINEASATLNQALARKLDDRELRFSIYETAFLLNDQQTMRQQLAWAAGRAGEEDWLLSAQADTEAYFGRLVSAREFSQRAISSGEHAGAKEAAALWQVDAALREAEFGNRELARQGALAALALMPGRDVRSVAGLALARAGETVPAQKLAEVLNKEWPLHTVVQGYWLPCIRAAIAINAKNPAMALQILRNAPPYELSQSYPFLLGMLYPIYLRGQAYLLMYQGKEAAAEFQEIIDHRGIVLNFPLGALAHLGLGRAYALQGDTAQARAAYQDFFTLWKDADPDIPILSQAKNEVVKLSRP
jgi:serine/threonine protein kinase/tetratricopeptide (TPR) repeat protein